MAPRSKSKSKSKSLQSETNWFCESCRDYHATYAALLRHNTAVHKPLRNRRPPNKIFFNFSKKNKNSTSDEPESQKNPGDVDAEPAQSQKINKPIFKCSECPSNFTAESRLLIHKKVHQQLFKCYECNEEIQRSKYYGHLSAHAAVAAAAEASALVSRTATDPEDYEIPIRRYVYLDFTDPRSGGEDELFWCHTCEPIHTFITKEEFENHNQLESHLNIL